MRVTFARALPGELARELESRLFFVSDAIERFELRFRDGLIEGVDVALAAETPEQGAIGEQIRRAVERDLGRQRALPQKALWQSAATPGRATDVLGELLERGAAFVPAEGQVAYAEPLIRLADWFDRRLRELATELGAREYRYPALLPTSALERFGYFGSFPQLVMFVTRLHSDIDVYDAFVRDYQRAGRLPDDVLDRCRDHSFCLPPTMCYHTFHQHRQRRLEGHAVVTANGRSFRFESRYASGFERLWDFTIREIVFMGDAGFAVDARARLMDRVFALVDELGLAGRCEVAHDHFFVDPDAAAKIFSQRALELKYELRLEVGAGRSVAAGSFNLHGSFFGEAFDITRADGEPIASACAGFGIERLVYAFLCQHGLDARAWPEPVASAVG